MIGVSQPTFLPYPGYFGYLNKVSNFVFLDDVQFNKRSWQQRNFITINKCKHLVTVPVISKGLYKQKINEVRIKQNQEFFEKLLKKIEENYKQYEFYNNYYGGFKQILKKKHSKLIDLNIDLINYFIKILEIKTKLHYSSKFNSKQKKSNLIIDICKKLNSTQYLSTLGSKDYLSENDFKNQKINLMYFKFSDDLDNKLNYSILDLIFSLGPKSKTYLESNLSILK